MVVKLTKSPRTRGKSILNRLEVALRISQGR